jgi:glycosyltransferase involved in cell wall biosynthesis
MNILINCSNLKVGGGLQVAHSFISSLYHFEQHKFIVVASTILYDQIAGHISPNNLLFKYDLNTGFFQSLNSNDAFLDNLVIHHEIKTVFTVFGPSYWRPKATHITGYAKPHYIYEDSPFFETISKKELLKLKVKKYVHLKDYKNNSDVLISENEDVSHKLRTIFPKKKVHTVTNFYNQIFDQPARWNNDLIIPYFDGFTLLTISANYPHKNLNIVPQVVKYLKINYPNFSFRFLMTIDEGSLQEGQSDAILYLGKINVNQCPPLYNEADAVFLPTLLECFTATYPEAMRMSKPILTSNLNFAKGLCDKAAVYFDPLDVRSIGDSIFSLSQDLNLRDNIVNLGKIQLQKFDSYHLRAHKYIEIITS